MPATTVLRSCWAGIPAGPSPPFPLTLPCRLLLLTAPGHPTAGVFGCDTLGTERRISPLEEACVAEVARYLAILLDEAQRGTALEDTLDEVQLAIGQGAGGGGGCGCWRAAPASGATSYM